MLIKIGKGSHGSLSEYKLSCIIFSGRNINAHIFLTLYQCLCFLSTIKKFAKLNIKYILSHVRLSLRVFLFQIA